MRKVLVTGGAGFIGSNLIRHLLGSHELVVFDNMSDACEFPLPSDVEVVIGDISDTEKLCSSLRGVDAIVHLAARGSVVDSVQAPDANFDTNVAGTFSVLQAARRAGIEKFVFASTGGAIIGDATPPVDETTLPKPISPYGASKLCCEAYCHAFGKAYGMQTVCLRFANIYGPYSSHKKGVLTRYFKQLFLNQPFLVYGDGTSTRDYLYVTDLCRGIEQALNYSGCPGEVFHLASGKETSINEVISTVLSVAGLEQHPVEYLPTRPGEVEKNCANFAKAAGEMGFSPDIDFPEGLAKMYAWYVQNREAILSGRA